MLGDEWCYRLSYDPHSGFTRCFTPPFWIVKVNTVLALLLSGVGVKTFLQHIRIRMGLLWSVLIFVLWILYPKLFYWWLYTFG